MKGGIAKHNLGGLRPLVIEMRGVLPGEADPAMDLDVLRRSPQGGLRPRGLGEVCRERKILARLGRRPARVVDRRARELKLKQHLRALVLHGLKCADRPRELDARFCVGHGHLEAARCTAHHLEGEAHGGLGERS